MRQTQSSTITAAPAAPEPLITVNAPWPADPPDEPVAFLQPNEMHWKRLVPDLGEHSPRMTVVRHDAQTGATTMLIWTPPGFWVPRHWHSGGEKHMVVRGTFIIECAGQRVVMKPGAFNYMPARLVHQAWTPPDEECLLYTDVDRLWDLNWIDSPPAAPSSEP